jgi:hypothetical protein
MAITLGEIDTFAFNQFSGGTSEMIFSIASLSTVIPTACCTSVNPKYCALSTFFGSSIGVGKDCAEKSNLQN